MNLYRLDFTDGMPVSDFIGPVLIRNSGVATARARVEAAHARCAVTITRISGGGQLRRVRTVNPDGTVNRIER